MSKGSDETSTRKAASKRAAVGESAVRKFRRRTSRSRRPKAETQVGADVCGTLQPRDMEVSLRGSYGIYMGGTAEASPSSLMLGTGTLFFFKTPEITILREAHSHTFASFQ